MPTGADVRIGTLGSGSHRRVPRAWPVPRGGRPDGGETKPLGRNADEAADWEPVVTEPARATVPA